MIPTNYYLFDFLDFDPELKREESLWKAYKPTAVYERDGDICIDVPFQKQVLSNDMEADLSVPQETYTIVIRYYEPKIIRIYVEFLKKFYACIINTVILTFVLYILF